MIVDIIDIGSGNIKSIQNWVERLNIITRIVENVSELKSDFIILPGVGSVGSYMNRLKSKGFDKAIIKHVNNNGKLMGICLGFQILGKFSEEDNGVNGLGILDCYTQRIAGSSHNGWEKFHLQKKYLLNQFSYGEMKLTRKQKIDGRVFYNHEYGVISKELNAYNLYIPHENNKYNSMIVKNNIIGIQFHPEKSQQAGIDIMSMIS